MFNVLRLTFHAGAQPFTPLVDCLIDDMLLKTRSGSNQSRLQISNAEHRRAVDKLLHDSAVHWIEVWIIRRPQLVAWPDQKHQLVMSAVNWHVVKLQVFTRYGTNM